MSEEEISKEEKSSPNYRIGKYFVYLVLILGIVEIIDAYSSVLPGAYPSAIAGEFLGSLSEDAQNSVLAIAGSITSIGMYVLFFNQYLADKIGRKKMLAVTVLGMAIATLGMFLSPVFPMYVFFLFLLSFFFSSDIWLIYINEEAKPNKRAMYSNILLTIGLIGPIIMIISRSIFITEQTSNWRGLMLFPMILGFPLFVVILLTIKETLKYDNMKEKASLREKRSFIGDLKSVFQTENRKPYIVVLIISFLYGFTTIFINLFEKYIDDVGTLTQDQVTNIFLLTALSVLIGYALNGLSDKIGRKPLLYLWSFIMPVSVIIWVVGAQDPNNALFWVTLGYALTHISYWGLLGIVRLIVIELIPTDRRGTGIGFRSLIQAIGITMGFLVSSGVILLVGLGTTFVIFVLLDFAILPLGYFFIKETKGIDLSLVK
jgi:MFS family permease